MKVAVISGEGTQSGKSSLILLLASVFSRTQRRKVAVFSTGDLDPVLNMGEVKETKSLSKSINVYNALLKSSAIRDKDLYDYAYRIGSEEVFGFNVFSASMARNDLEVLFNETVDKIKADLVLIEVVGSLEDEFNMSVVNSADAILYVFNTERKSINNVLEYINTFNEKSVIRTGFVCQKYDRNVYSEKQLGKALGVSVSNIMQLPYNSVIVKECLSGTVNTLAKFIAEGNSEVINLRSKMLEIMQYLFDTGAYKYIKGVNEWHK